MLEISNVHIEVREITLLCNVEISLHNRSSEEFTFVNGYCNNMKFIMLLLFVSRGRMKHNLHVMRSSIAIRGQAKILMQSTRRGIKSTVWVNEKEGT
ncbi:hypothetical protein TNIN_17811 [Trichonephila inaurata madagascariensis]|uniref:Uncharacterized protein n=1 Tax=Trichonephila inaurata madagascariensis TaxID=2747483 RepID=A0A8X6X376_9ARAC|nr:hypothetical protein TNIN_17811 [Trichonephila inaurata madagascariensis]